MNMDFDKLMTTLMYFIPAAIVLGAAYLLVKNFLDNDYRVRLLEVKKAMAKDMLPLRLQAYERLVLFLERISPANLLIRVNEENLSAMEFQNNLLKTIRAEYEHNMSQQVYITSLSWELIKMAKEDMVKVINIAAKEVGPNGTAVDLSREIFQVILSTDKIPTYKALEHLKEEVRLLM
jgi:hypothetical protein